ncbi:unnamed protein product [Nezara viridula]|uniref:Uncharacterized protein n=1 Tax=Nezara viridula TaxID=85310 RepID=A0A9P0EA04_NEZVI|nr:unnamed protein product [Nezara viridula]
MMMTMCGRGDPKAAAPTTKRLRSRNMGSCRLNYCVLPPLSAIPPVGSGPATGERGRGVCCLVRKSP